MHLLRDLLAFFSFDAFLRPSGHLGGEFSRSVLGLISSNAIVYHALCTCSGLFFQFGPKFFHSRVVLGGLVHVVVFLMRFYVPPGTWVSPSIVKMRPKIHGYRQFSVFTIVRDPVFFSRSGADADREGKNGPFVRNSVFWELSPAVARLIDA